ncbi:MAG: hypothetical protein GXO88_10490 [Chlorobi bacterium]|nr:hypothetical protein [Chlorobiota bacterium]
MKQQITFLVVFILFCASDIYVYKPNSLEGKNLKGEIKNITKLKSVLNYDAGKQTTENTIETYDRNGRMLELRKLKNHKLFSRINYHYSAEGVLDHSTETNPDGSRFLSITYKYDENGFLRSKRFNRAEQRKYDSERQKTEVEYEQYYNNLFTEVLYKCDYKGYKLEEKFLKQNKQLSYKLTYKYDYKYQLVELKYYNSKGQAGKRTKYRYNQEGDVLESKTYISNRLALSSSYSYTYDARKNWVSRTEKRKLGDNFFASDMDTSNILTQRIIAYYN